MDALPAKAPERRPALGVSLLALLVLAVYQPVLTARAPAFAFLNVDDERYVVENPFVTGGLTRQGVLWALTSHHDSNWHPLTWMSLQLDAQLHGTDPWGFHLTNVVLHAANAGLLFWFLRRVTGAWWRSLVVAGLFAVHPLHVESVAWITERKDVLSTFFGFLSLLAYASYAARPALHRYALVALAFALSLMAKSMLVTLPGVLLLLDVWPLGRLAAAAPAGATGVPRAGIARLILEKLPLLALSAGCAWLTVQAQDRMMEALPQVPLGVRAGNALWYYLTYVGRMFWPTDLVVYRPNPGVSQGVLRVLGGGLALAAVSAFAVRAWPRRPYLLVGWLLYLGMLVPVIGLVQVGYLATTDHYTYVPLVGLFLMLVWGVHEIVESRPLPRALPVALAAAPLLLCVVVARRQVLCWRSSVAVWQHVVEASPENAFARAFLGRSLEAEGRDAEAEEQLTRSMQLDPTWKEHVDRGLALEREGDLWGSRRELETALLMAPHAVTALEHLAAQYQARGEVGDALREYGTLARLQPQNPIPQHNLGLLYRQQGDLAQARAHLTRALALDPGLAAAREALAALPAEGAPDAGP